MPAYQLEDHKPHCHPSVWIAPGAHVIGQAELGAHCSVWFNAVIRADNDRIKLGTQVNVQDGAILHTDPGFEIVLSDRVSVGHQAMVHGCHVGEGSLIGIQAIVLNGARIGKCCLIGAGALITEGKEIPDNSLVVGSPGKVVRSLTNDECAGLLRIAAVYADRAQRYRSQLRSCGA
ncbi:MAG TPA: gamma carbonic anhydrase family protein [Lautropia sp.]|nr:gamma carbonic anhydrase family protein [Lautropia sp.]